MIGNKKWAGPVIYRTLARLEGKKGAARWEPGDAPNDVLRVRARPGWHRHRRERGIVGAGWHNRSQRGKDIGKG